MAQVVKFGNTVEHRRHRQNRIDCQGQRRLPAVCGLTRPLFGTGGGLQQQAPVVQQYPPRMGEAGTMTGTVEDQHIEIGFELLHSVGQARRGAVEFFGGAGE